VAEIVFHDDCAGHAEKPGVNGETVMYAAVIGLYTVKQNTNADIADHLSKIVLTLAGRYLTKFSFLVSPLCAVVSRE
jgi:hypothetical protein